MLVRNRAGKEYASVALTTAAGGVVHVHAQADGVFDIEKDLQPQIAREGDDLVVKCEVGPWGSDFVITPQDFRAIKGLMTGDVIKWAIKAFFR